MEEHAVGGAPRYILVVEENAPLKRIVARSLEAVGQRTIPASSRREALEIFERGRVGFVLTCCKLPDGTGIGLIRELLELAPGCPFLLTTGGPLSGIPGGWPYLAKPFKTAELQSRVLRLLASQS